MRPAPATTGGETGMTDYQFRTIIKMILAIAKGTRDTDTIIRTLESMLPQGEESGDEKE
jgi:hypothetical protein